MSYFRPFYSRCALLVVAITGAAQFVEAAEPPKSPPVAAESFDGHLKPFLTSYCVACHGDQKQKGDRRFDRLTGAIADDGMLVDFQDMLDQLNLGEMPPKDARQPSEGERRQAIAWLTGRIEQSRREREPTAGETVLRRLNLREYRNTVRDLLHLNMSMFDPTAGFPRDQMTDHLDNVGSTLVMSGTLLQRYLAAAEQIIDKALGPAERPPVQMWSFRGNFRQQPEIDQTHVDTNGFSHITLYDVVGADKLEGAYGPIWDFKQGVPHDGFYEIRFRAEAVNRLHPYDRDFVGTDPTEPLRLGIVAGNILAGPLHKPQPIEPLLAEMDLADKLQWYTVRIWLDAGYTPRFTFRNGLMDVRLMWGRLVRTYADQFPPPVRGRIGEHRTYSIKYGKLPQIRIHEVEIEGPFYDEWPTPSQRALLGDNVSLAAPSVSADEESLRRQLTLFASRAFRRPAQPEEIDRLWRGIATRRESGRSPREAYRDGLTAVLCSPAFLYLDEPRDKDDPGEERLSLHAFASRLSYFLWSSMPDQELLDLAASGKLSQPNVLQAQVRRMLSDRRSAGFIEGFLDSWLTLRDLGSMPPDRAKFAAFYRYNLQAAMRRETHLFTRYILDNNLSIANFLDSDFTFVNKALAKHYGIAPPRGNDFEKVSLEDRRRGGLLGQASVLTLTANGIDTSPVVRGVWMLENIFGTPPSPPPPDVEPLDPDIRGATTIREQLEKHRSVAACYDCHRRIDPPGFALENFDAIGAWRDRYARQTDDHASIDAKGELPSGESFANVVELKALLAARVDQFAHCLTEKLLAYSLGRTLEAADRPQVDGIVAEAKAHGYGLADLVLLVASSHPFKVK